MITKPSTAPTIAATGIEFVWFDVDGATTELGAGSDAFSVIVLYDVPTGPFGNGCEVVVTSLVVVSIELGESVDVVGEAVLLGGLAGVSETPAKAG